MKKMLRDLFKRFKYDTSNLRGDLFGGITAGIVALPLALAFGVQSGMGAIAGLYGAIALGIFAATFGGTPVQISGPTGPMTVVSVLVVKDVIDSTGSLENGYGTIITIFFIAGFVLVLFGLFKLGTYIKYIPYPVVSGFMSGIGVIIIILQIFPFMGQASPGSIIEVFKQLSAGVQNVNSEAMLVSGSTIAIIYIFPKITRAIPSSLVALLLVTLFANWMNLSVPLIGDIPKGIPELQIGKFSLSGLDLNLIIELALTLM